jgi:hypothetical protein
MKSLPLDQILSNAGKGSIKEARSTSFSMGAADQDQGFTSAIGYHIYTKIKLRALLTDPDNLSNAGRYLKVVNAFTRSAEKLCLATGVRLLEVQGHVHHFLCPQEDTDIVKLEEFCTALNIIAYQQIEKIAGKDGWGGFSCTAEHGFTVILNTANNSVISLGPAANNPAKKLHKGTDASTLVYRRSDAAPFTWNTIVLEKSGFTKFASASKGLYESQVFGAEEYFSQPITPEVVRLRSYADIGRGVPESPVRVQGHFFRADLTGFTARVKAATKDNKQIELMNLAVEIDSIIREAESILVRYSRKVVILPWAGDCANFVVLPSDPSTFASERGGVPPDMSCYWMAELKKVARNYSWTIGVACAGPDDKLVGQQGVLLLAQIVGENRRYEIAAGWGVGRSIRAQDHDAASGGDTVMPIEDYKTLKASVQQVFSACDGNYEFYKGRIDCEELRNSEVVALSAATTTQQKYDLPVSRPWFVTM